MGVRKETVKLLVASSIPRKEQAIHVGGVFVRMLLESLSAPRLARWKERQLKDSDLRGGKLFGRPIVLHREDVLEVRRRS